MGCSGCRIRFNFGKALSKASLLLTMLLISTYFIYCLTALSDSIPRALFAQRALDYGILEDRRRVLDELRPSPRLLLAGAPASPPPGGAQDSGIPVSNTFGTKKFPQAIIIGVKKGGTRALLEFLRIHPDVRAVGAEPHFFDRFYEKGLDWYRELMPRTLEGQITMEKTPSYFVTKEAPGRVCGHELPNQAHRGGPGPRDPGLSLALKNASSGLIDTAWNAVRIGLYAKHLENWLRHFPLSHFLFVSGERLVSDPAGEMGRVQDFLGLKRVISDKHFYFNQTKGFPCLKKPEGSSRPRCLGKSKGRPHPHIPPEVLQRLREFYRPFNHHFYQMSGRDFGWD
ncbi:hypothetical protein fugu_015494 [Takifugu bimaculatus]|uniref:Sulfotransferase n=1 Tax=Takifugu bimaculatus TaxID=433685 RepID=A0A4Z2C030_9TELE|nr:hypothetical protein fugu_015494 [Takifugu bimaculatus]